MVTLDRASFQTQPRYAEYVGLDTDEKPIGTLINNGDEFQEINTGKVYKFNGETSDWVEQPSGSGGAITGDYNDLTGKPQINGVVLEGNKTTDDLNITISEEEIANAVDTWLTEHPEATTTVENGSIGIEKLTQELSDELGLERHEYTESPVELKRAVYNSFYNGTETTTGTGTSTVLFKTPQKIKITNNHSIEIVVAASRFANSEDYQTAEFINSKNRREGNFLSQAIPVGQTVTFETYEYGAAGCEYIQLRFQPSEWYGAWNNISVTAVYDSYRPSYTLPQPIGLLDEDLPVKYVFQGTSDVLARTSLVGVAPYYPNFTYNIRGGYYPTIAHNKLSVIYLLNDEIFDGYHSSIVTNITPYSDNFFIPRINAGGTTQYDTSVNAGADSEYAWAYHTTPTEAELVGPKWVAICEMGVINQPADTDLGEEYYNQQIEDINNRGLRFCYITKFNNKNAPRRLLSAYAEPIKMQSDGSQYSSILNFSACPLAGKKWTLFGDSLTSNYGGKDLSSNYFASKIAREFGMELDNRAQSGTNINTGANGNYTNINGCAMLDELISEVEQGTTTSPDYITVAFGSNGYASQIGTIDDTSADKDTTCGAVKYFIEKCTEKFPDAFLGFILPPLGSWSADDGQKFPNPNKDINATRDAMRSVLEIPEYGGIPYIDMSKKSGITLAMLPDKIHINTPQANAHYYRAIRGFLNTAWS